MRWLTFLLILIPLAGCPAARDGSTTGADTASQTAAERTPVVAEVNGPDAVIVWADPLLKVTLEALAADFSKLHAAGYKVIYMERGEFLDYAQSDPPPPAPDVMLVADNEVYTTLLSSGLIEEVTSRVFAGDRLVLVQPAGGEYRVGQLYDVYKLRFEAFAIGADNTAAGYFARQALLTEGGLAKLEDRLAGHDSGPDLVAALVAGEMKIGIVCHSSVVQTAGLEIIKIIGEDLHEDIRYRAAAATGASERDGVIELLRYLAEEPAVQDVLPGYGLKDRKQALQEVQ